MQVNVRKLESITRGIEKSIAGEDTAKQYQLTVVLLAQLLEQHKAMLAEVGEMETEAKRLNTFETQYKHVEHYHTRGGGWGRNRSSGYTVGSPGNQLRKIAVVDVKQYHERVASLCLKQIQHNDNLTLLTQYADEFHKHRKALLGLKPKNVGQRTLQNILEVSGCGVHWPDDKHNTVLSCIHGEFAHHVNMSTILSKYVKPLNDKKGLIGRRSVSGGMSIVKRCYYDSRYASTYNPERYTGKRCKADRAERVNQFVSNSERYKSKLSWIRGIYDVAHCLPIVRYVDGWKERYAATNRLAYLNSANQNPYVKTIVTSQLEQVGTIEHLETTIPVYLVRCITWQSKDKTEQYSYFLGKSGSAVIDGQVTSVDWYHSSDMIQTNTHRLQAIDYLRQRLGYARDQKLTLLQRRKEIASYARKLTWLESISMLDSKNAGNCLPGTIQFAKELGLPCPSSWNNFTVDARQLLRAWKAKGYNANRLLLPAIDKAVERVKHTLRDLTVSCYVPSVVNN